MGFYKPLGLIMFSSVLGAWIPFRDSDGSARALNASRLSFMAQVSMGQPDLPDAERRLNLDLKRHLRLSIASVGKVDGIFAHLVFQAMREVRHLHLKDIAR